VTFTGQKLGQELTAHLAAYPVTEPVDVVQNGKTGVLDQDLRQAVAYARQHSWRHWTERFVSLLEPIKETGGNRPEKLSFSYTSNTKFK